MAVEKILETDTLNQGRIKINAVLDQSNASSEKVDGYKAELTEGIKQAKEIARTAGDEAKEIAEEAGELANQKADQAIADSKTAVDTANRAVSTANQNKQEFDALRNEFDGLVAESGDSNPEIVQARTDTEGIKQSTLQARLTSDFNNRLTTTDAMQMFSGAVNTPKMMDFKGKTANNTNGNPHRAFSDYTATTLKKPSANWNEFTQDNYNKVVSRDDTGISTGSSQNGVIPQQLYTFDVKAAVESIADGIFDEMTISQAVKYIKDRFVSLKIPIRGKATAPNNKNLKVATFLESSDSYSVQMQNSAPDYTDFAFEITDSNYINAEGKINVLVFTDSSNGVTPSSVDTDYIGAQITVTLNALDVLEKSGFAKTEAVDKQIQDHTTNFDNPHKTNKAHIGLSNVPNFPAATRAEAENATTDSQIMSPLRTRQLIDLNYGQAFTAGTKFIAHRGNNYFYPENSIVAFEKVSRHWGSETDVQITTDGKWYCFHDRTVDRMTNGTGNFMDKTSAQVEALRLDDGNGIKTLSDTEKKIPTFEQYLNACLKARTVPVIEITPLKTDFTDEQLDSLVTAIRRKGLVNRCVIICFTLDVLIKMRRKMPSTVMHYLTSTYTADMLSSCKDNNLAISIDATSTSVTQSLIDNFHDAGLEVGIWTVPYADHEKYTNMGIDYISTDDPSGNLRYFEPTLRSGMLPNNSELGGATFIEETANGEIHIRINVTGGQNDVGVYICALESWAIPRHSLTLIGHVRSTKVTGLTFVPVSVGVGGYSANDSSIAISDIQFGYLTTGTNWGQRATYTAMDLYYKI